MQAAVQNPEQQYERLTTKQRAIIEAHAEDPWAQNRAKSKRAGEILTEWVEDDDRDVDDEIREQYDQDEEMSVNESYALQILNNKYPAIANWRASQEHDDLLWSDGELGPSVTVDVYDDGVTLHLSKQYLSQVLDGDSLPPDLQEQVLEALLDEAFQ